jgi:hypothetical protein
MGGWISGQHHCLYRCTSSLCTFTGPLTVQGADLHELVVTDGRHGGEPVGQSVLPGLLPDQLRPPAPRAAGEIRPTLRHVLQPDHRATPAGRARGIRGHQRVLHREDPHQQRRRTRAGPVPRREGAHRSAAGRSGRRRDRTRHSRRRAGLSWLTILGSGQTRRCDLHVLGSRELNCALILGRRVARCRMCGR